MKLRFSWYQIKIFSLCLLLGVLPLLLLGLFSYTKFSGVIQEKVYRGNDMLLQQTQSQIESTLRTVEFSIFQLSQSPAVHAAIQKGMISPHDFKIVDNLIENIQALQLYKFGIKDIQVMNLSNEWVVSNMGYQLLQDFSFRDRIDDYSSLKKPTMWVTDRILYPTMHSDNTIYLVSRFPVFSPKPSLLIVTEMSNKELFENVPRNSELGTVMIVDGNGNIITNSEGEEIEALTIDTEQIQKILDSDEVNEYFVDSIHSEDYGITYRKSPYNDWIYLSIVSIHDITKESRAIGLATLWTCIIISAIVSILSFQGAHRLYTPIGRLYGKVIQSDNTQDKPAIRDEFKTIEKLYFNMHHNQHQLEDHIQKLHHQLKQFSILKLVQGNLKSNEIIEQFRKFGYAENYRWLAVVTIQIDTLDNTAYEERDNDLLLFAISNIVDDLTIDKDRLDPIVIKQCQVTIINGNHQTEEQFKTYLYETVRTIQEKVQLFLKLNITIGISRPYQDYNLTPKAYAEGLDALKYRITVDESILFIEDVEPEGLMMLFPDNLEKQLIEAVKFFDEERASVLLKEFMSIVSNRELTYSQIQNWLMKLLLDLIYIPEQQGITIPALHGDGANVIPLYEQLKALKTVEEIEEWFTSQIIQPIIEAMDDSKGIQYNKIADEVIRIIEREFDRDLSLEECAMRLNYHPSYIRRVLKKSLNVSFMSYLLQYRMEMAKKWLTETDMKVMDIANNLRYKNSQNFIRYFKKVTDMTPGQYRTKWHIEKKADDS